MIKHGLELVDRAAFSPDSRLLALGRCAGGPHWDYIVQLWDVSTGSEFSSFRTNIPCEDEADDYIAFSPDGKTLAAAVGWDWFPFFPFLPGNLLRLWGLPAGEPIRLSTSYHSFVLGLAFSPDSAQLAVANNKHISLFDVREREEVHRFECRAFCRSPRFSPDGKLIAAVVGKQRIVRVWDVDTGREQPLHSGRTLCLDSPIFYPIGKTLTELVDNSTIRFWDVPSGLEIRTIILQPAAQVQRFQWRGPGAPCPFYFTPDGKGLVGAEAEPNPIVHMWDANTGKELQHWDLTPLLDELQP